MSNINFKNALKLFFWSKTGIFEVDAPQRFKQFKSKR